MTPFYFDIETGPDPREGALQAILDTIQPPANYKKKETIDAWMENNALAQAENKWQRTSLDAAKSYIASAAFASEDFPIYGLMNAEKLHEAESWLINNLFDHIKAAADQADDYLCFVGHNIIGFDIPFIWRRAMVHGIKPPSMFPSIDGRASNKGGMVYDTMREWAGWRDMISQDALCEALGIPQKDQSGPVGATVWEYLASPNCDKRLEVLDYNKRDVETIRQIHRKMTFADSA